MTDEKKPEKKGMGTGPKIAIGCGVVAVVGIIIIAVVVISGGVFLSKKAKEAGIDADLLKKNPALAAAKVAIAANPELELMNVDEDSRKITIRNKKTGEKLKVDFEDIEKGRISFETEEGEMTIKADEAGASAEIKDKEGDVESVEFSVSSDRSKLPDWIPLFKGKLNISFTGSDQETSAGNFSIETDAKPKDIQDFYVSRLEKQGFTVEISSSEFGGSQLTNLTFSDDDQRHVSVNIQEQDDKSMITVHYQIKK